MADSGRANETLARIVPIVRPGGMLIVGGYDGLGRFLAGFRGTRSNTGSGRVSAGEAARLIARHGFTVTSVLPTVDGADAHANGLQTSMATVREGGLMLLIGRRDRWQ
jgi:hypothetical protein